MFYAIRHFTRYRYSNPVWESVMELRMHPRSDNAQRCFTFQLSISPRARIFSYVGHLGNIVHHFDIPEQHAQITIIADALVDVDEPAELPQSLGSQAWRDLDRLIESDDYWDMLMPSQFARKSPELEAFAKEIGAGERRADPLTLVREVNQSVYEAFDYVRESTRVDSPIEHVLSSRKGVCQDFAHVMTTLLRNLHIPCRYVSGYICHDMAHHECSSDGASHAWVEVLLPELGWVGFDPTNNLTATGGHIRTAIGRDYADVPPSIGTMKGSARTTLQVRVRVTQSDSMLAPDEELASDQEWSRFLEEDQEAQVAMQAQPQQQ
jgi:transglutaminase-like putative cysteine protease